MFFPAAASALLAVPALALYRCAVRWWSLRASRFVAESGGEASCEPNVSFPNPFLLESLEGLYDREGLLSLSLVFDHGSLWKTWGPLAERVSAMSASCEGRRALRQLLDSGLAVTPLGMDFSMVQASRYPSSVSGADLKSDADVLRLREAYYATRIHRFFWDVDMPGWYRPLVEPPGGLAEGERRLLASFRRDGFVRIDRWAGLDLEALAGEATPKIERGQHITGIQQSVEDLRGVAPLLKEGSLLWRLVLGYLGVDARYNGVEAFRLAGGVAKRTYSNAAWHHDGCGSRLKAFVYLHDVDERSHPTLIAGGTQHTQWFPTTHFYAGPRLGQNKLNETLVWKTYGRGIEKMLGRAGGGFIFDSNALHAADVEGKHRSRDVVVLDFAGTEHLKRMPKGKRGPEDNFRSGFLKGLCPQSHRGGRKFVVPHWTTRAPHH